MEVKIPLDLLTCQKKDIHHCHAHGGSDMYVVGNKTTMSHAERVSAPTGGTGLARNGDFGVA